MLTISYSMFPKPILAACSMVWMPWREEMRSFNGALSLPAEGVILKMMSTQALSKATGSSEARMP